MDMTEFFFAYVWPLIIILAESVLRGFFWPRQKYENAAEIERVRDNLREAMRRVLGGSRSDGS